MAKAKRKHAGMTWREFLTGRMGPAMKKHRSHGAALKALSAEYRHMTRGSRVKHARKRPAKRTRKTRKNQIPLSVLRRRLARLEKIVKRRSA